MRFRFHVVGVPNTQTTKQHCTCAYTQKVLNFCKMMHTLGHTVFHYGAAGSNPPCTEHVDILSEEERLGFFGDNDVSKDFASLRWDADEPYFRLCNTRAAKEILKRKQSRDFICVIGGYAQKPIADLMPPDVLVVEYGIGYMGVFSHYRCFESHAHMHRYWGSQKLDCDGEFYDAVIPNYFDPADFTVQPVKEDYLLFVGRLVARKGVAIAVQTANAVGKVLKIAGQGVKNYIPGRRLETGDGVYEGNIEYVGTVNVQQRNALMGKARALLAPTIYVEPFGGVNVEAQMCSTPVIASAWGAFPETVEHGRTGFLCRTLKDYVSAVYKVRDLDPHYIAERARRLYSLDSVAIKYDDYFRSLWDLWGKGWPELPP